VVAQPISVGIIPNPASGSDIRRLVALGTVFGTQDKINIVQRIMVGLATAGIDQCFLMPDAYHIGEAALKRLPKDLAEWKDHVQILNMPMENCAEDSICAARRMQELGVGCILALGGDGTSRVVAKGSGSIPILPISTGTNNVISYLVEGTIAGLAAGFVARFPEMVPEVSYRSKWLDVHIDGKEKDIALVDVAILDGQIVGSRAIWEPESLRGAILTRAEPRATGVSSIGGFLRSISPLEPRGLYLKFGEPQICRMTAPLAPGLMTPLAIEAIRDMAIGDGVTVEGGNSLLALDGEREIPLRQSQTAEIFLRQDGPWIVDVYKALNIAVQQKFFIQ